jgi:hypothetical protein
MTAQWYDFALHVEKRVARPFRTDVDGEDLHGFKSYDLQVGKRLRNWDPNACLRSISEEDDGEPDDVLLEHLKVPTFSRRLHEALSSAGVGGKDIQYLPVRVFRSTGEELEGYAFANVITRVAALDYEATDWGALPPDPDEGIDPNTGRPAVQAIWRAALIEASLKGHDIIRLVEFFPPVFVSERFAEIFRDGEFTGATLTPVIMT